VDSPDVVLLPPVHLRVAEVLLPALLNGEVAQEDKLLGSSYQSTPLFLCNNGKRSFFLLELDFLVVKLTINYYS
jgi:hypothetical protein